MENEKIRMEFDIPGDDFTRAGSASSEIKGMLKKMGVPPAAVRRVAIAMYEGEINMVIHGGGGKVTVEVTPKSVAMKLADQGPGIADIDKAMQEGFSTAPESVRNLGFGAGMGLPNMKKYSDFMRIDSEVGKGTTVTMCVFLDEDHDH